MERFRERWTVSHLAALFGLMGSVLFFSGSLWAEEDDLKLQRNRLQLNRVIKQLMTEKKALSKAKGEEKGLLADLERIDKKLDNTQKRLVFLDRQRQRAKNDLPKWAKEVEVGRLRVDEMRQQLMAHLRLMYGLGGQGIIKVALSQEDSSRVRQSILYYGRLIKSRNAQFKIFQDSIKSLNRSVLEYENLVSKVEKLSEELTQERQKGIEERRERTALLKKLQQENISREQKVVELSAARLSLSSFMEKLSGALSSTPEGVQREPEPAPLLLPTVAPKYAVDGGEADRHRMVVPEPRRRLVKKNDRSRRITQIKGQLPTPVQAVGRTRKPGLFFRVAQNSPVKAVYRAQVVYADWFRGYGLLIILNHGDHIYSLYGHNKKLLVTPGDQVEAFQTIANTGDTGSLEGIPGLYFEIRRRGQAENPKRWLVSSR
jgi:murein hydrolase activator